MSQKIQRLLYIFASLSVIALAGVSTSARADQGAPSGYDCLGTICVGTQVNVIAGQWAGRTGAVVGVDLYNDTVTVIDSFGTYLYPYATDVRSIFGDSPQSSCSMNVCVGNQVRVLYGQYAGYFAQVVGTNAYTLQATLLLQGQYVTVNLRDISVIAQQPLPMPIPRPMPTACPIGYIYDYYRGCVRIVGSYPMPQRRDYPTPFPGRDRDREERRDYPTPFPGREQRRDYPTPDQRRGGREQPRNPMPDQRGERRDYPMPDQRGGGREQPRNPMPDQRGGGEQRGGGQGDRGGRRN